LIGTIKAKWGYAEYIDHRVFLAYEGSLELDIVKVSFDAAVGFKCFGAADLLLVGKGEGTLGLSVVQFTKQQPDQHTTAKLTPRGAIKIGIGIEGQVMWAAKAEGVIELCFKAETEDFEFLSDKAVLAGTIIVSREEIAVKITASCWLWGSTTSKPWVIKEADKRFAVINF
jgi:hypothetical protein